MARYALADHQFARLAPLLPGKQGDRGRAAHDNRLFLDAVLWIARNGGPWRDLPERFGKWNTVFVRFNRWSKRGLWQRLFDAVQDPDMDWLLLDSTVVSAHQEAARGRKRGIRPRGPQIEKRSGVAVAG
jgi:putative transposase